jgi:hypothetical protein
METHPGNLPDPSDKVASFIPCPTKPGSYKCECFYPHLVSPFHHMPLGGQNCVSCIVIHTVTNTVAGMQCLALDACLITTDQIPILPNEIQAHWECMWQLGRKHTWEQSQDFRLHHTSSSCSYRMYRKVSACSGDVSGCGVEATVRWRLKSRESNSNTGGREGNLRGS